jgi:hypothetical protein
MKIEIKTYQIEIMNKSLIRAGLNVIKIHGAGFSTAILSLAMLAGLSACQSEQSPPVASAAQPQVQVQVQAQAPEMSPREQIIHRRAAVI